MKYSAEIEINLPVQKVIELFDSVENLKKWQPDLVSFNRLSGTPGQPGAKSVLKYKMGRREIEMIETITVRNLPSEFSGTYEAKGVYNVVRNKFVPVNPNKTLYQTEQEFRFSGFMKIIGTIMPGAFVKQTKKHLQRFKDFAEQN